MSHLKSQNQTAQSEFCWVFLLSQPRKKRSAGKVLSWLCPYQIWDTMSIRALINCQYQVFVFKEARWVLMRSQPPPFIRGSLCSGWDRCRPRQPSCNSFECCTKVNFTPGFPPIFVRCCFHLTRCIVGPICLIIDDEGAISCLGWQRQDRDALLGGMANGSSALGWFLWDLLARLIPVLISLQLQTALAAISHFLTNTY